MNIPTDPNRIVKLHALIGEFDFINYMSNDQFTSYFKYNHDKILSDNKHYTPTSISIELYTNYNDDSTKFQIYASTIEPEEDYDERLRALQAEKDEQARSIIRRAEGEAASAEVFRQTAERKAREKSEALVLSDDPELLEYKRLKEKFKIYEKVGVK